MRYRVRGAATKVAHGWMLSLVLTGACATAGEVPEVPVANKPSPEYTAAVNAPAPPYIYNLGGLTAEEVENINPYV